MCAQRCCSGDLAEPLGGKYVGNMWLKVITGVCTQ